MARPLRKDPTRTTRIQNNFAAEIRRRFKEVSKAVKEAVEVMDVFGIEVSIPFSANAATQYTPVKRNFVGNVSWQEYRFQTDAQKITSFRRWFEGQVETKVLSTNATGAPWSAEYVESAYKKGIVRAYIDSKPNIDLDNMDFYAGSRSQFLADAFAAPEAVSKVELVATRSFEGMRGISDSMKSSLNNILANGLANGTNPRTLARDMVKSMDGISKTRALRIARTEVVYAHAEGQLDSFEKLGVEEIGAMAEWSTAGDNRVCPLCSALEGVTLTVKKARGMIPRHPNCRCAWIPAFVDMKEKGQKRGKRATRAIEKSKELEKPKKERGT